MDRYGTRAVPVAVLGTEGYSAGTGRTSNSGAVKRGEITIQLCKPTFQLFDTHQLPVERRNVVLDDLPHALGKNLAIVMSEFIAKADNPGPLDVVESFLSNLRNVIRRFTEYFKLTFGGQLSHLLAFFKRHIAVPHSRGCSFDVAG